MNRMVEKFVDGVWNINEADYGDFMRKANQYLVQLKEGIDPEMNPIAQQKIEEMQQYIQFSPTWELETTQKRFSEDALYVSSILANEIKKSYILTH